jgi:peptidoglycan-N-acetylglucosamine deacetylase
MRITLAALTVLTLTACATQNSPVAPSPTTSSTPSAIETSSPLDALTANGDVPRVLDPDLLSDFPITVTSETTYSRHIYSSWPHFGRTAIDAAITSYFRTTVSSFEKAYPDPKPNTSATPELNLEWHLLASSPQAVEIVADGFKFTGADGTDFWHSIWIDPASDTVLKASDLVDVATTNTALEVAATKRKAKISSLDLSQVGPDPLNAATLVAFSPSGDLIVGFDECQVAACTEGRLTLTIPAATVAPLLTEVGRQAHSATTNPGSAASPNPTTSATPSASPTKTPSASPTKPTSSPTSSTVNCRKLKCIALTFDDGPGAYTTKLLGYLKDKQVKATFFMLGQQVDTFPKVAKAVARAGHEIGVHTWDHRSLPQLSTAQIDSELSSTIDIIANDTGITPTLLRPPYGAMNTRVKTEAKKYGLAIVLWNVDTLDWKTRSTPKTVAAALKDTRRGSIILVHDIHKTTVEAVPGIIDGLRAKGYTFVTVTQLLGNPQPGKKYFSGRTR